MRFDLMPLLAQACRAVARQDHTKAWEHLEVNDEDEFDRLVAEASGLADQGELYTDKFPGKQACVERSRPMRQPLTMLGMTRRRRRCQVRKRGERKEPWLTRKRCEPTPIPPPHPAPVPQPAPAPVPQLAPMPQAPHLLGLSMLLFLR